MPKPKMGTAITPTSGLKEALVPSLDLSAIEQVYVLWPDGYIGLLAAGPVAWQWMSGSIEQCY